MVNKPVNVVFLLDRKTASMNRTTTPPDPGTSGPRNPRPRPGDTRRGVPPMLRHEAYPLADLAACPPPSHRVRGVSYTLAPRARFAHLPACPRLMADVIVDLGGDFRLACAVLAAPAGPVLAVPREAVDLVSGGRVPIAVTEALARDIFHTARSGRGGHS